MRLDFVFGRSLRHDHHIIGQDFVDVLIQDHHSEQNDEVLYYIAKWDQRADYQVDLKLD